jgi:Beta protein
MPQNSTTSRPIYVPILKAKEGEFGALSRLLDETKDLVRPFIDVPEVATDFETGEPAKSIGQHVGNLAARIRESWGTGRPFLLNLPKFRQGDMLADGTSVVAHVLRDCAEQALFVVPAVTRGTSPERLMDVRSYLADQGAVSDGACVRLQIADVGDDVNLDTELDRLLTKLAVGPGDIDLVVDLGDVGADVGRAAILARYALGAAREYTKDWRRVVLAGASFPEDLSEVSAATVQALPRNEWALWQMLHRSPKKIGLRLIFGDYAISHPIAKELDPRTMRMSASVRYTTENAWMVVKGRNVRQFGYDQYYDLSRIIHDHADYAGESFSWGDDYIAKCARREEGPGNATTWRKVATNHHISRVTQDLVVHSLLSDA